MLKIVSLSCLILSFSFSALATEPKPSLPDPGFEEKNASGLPAGWIWGSSSPKAKVSCLIVDEKPRSGKSCVKLTTDQPVEPNVYGSLSVKIPCEPMTEYQFTLYVRAEEHNGDCWFGGGRNWLWRNPIPKGTYDWTRLDGWYRTGPDETSFSFMVNVEGKAKGIWIDDIRMERMARSTDPTVKPPITPWTKDKVLAAIQPIREKALQWRQRLEFLRKKGAHIDYALIKLSLIETFLPRIDEELKKDPKYLLQATMIAMELKPVAIGLEKDLAELEKDPTSVPAAVRYRTGKIERDGYTQIGSVLDPATGKTERRPVIFTGYGNFHTVLNESAKWQDLGCNVITPEMGPSSVVSGKPDGTLVVDEKPIDELVKKFKAAAEHNVAIVFLISPHYMPPCSGSAFWYGDEPGVSDVMEAYMRALIPKIKDIPSLHSIVLSNEPACAASPDNKHFYHTWRQFLRKKYGTIDKLNKMYGGTTYKGFWEVPLPPGEKWLAGYYEPKDRVWHGDWMTCNNLRFAEWHKRIADVIHEEAPNVAVHTKICAGYMQGSGLPVANGIDPEMFAGFTQYVGYDDASGVRITNDVMSSFQKAPAVNSENHILTPDENYNMLDPRRFYLDLFAQAMHGQFISTAWTYEPTCEPMALWDFSVRPACMEAYGRAGLDLMRVAPALAAIQNTPRQVAIIYSPTSFYYNEDHHPVWRAAWDAFFGTGLRVRFLSENQIQKSDFGDTKVLILPEAQVVESQTLDGLKTFTQAGGKVIFVGHSLEYTPGWMPVEKKLADSLAWKKLDPSLADWQRQLTTLVAEAGIVPDVMLTSPSGQQVPGIHWLCGTLNGQKVIAVLNMTDKPVELTVNGGKTAKIFNLITEKESRLPATVPAIGATVWRIE